MQKQRAKKVIPDKETVKKVDKQQPTPEKVAVKVEDFPPAFQKGAEGKNTQKLVDYINGIEGADPNVLKLYANMGKLENLNTNGIPFKISHGKNHAVTTWRNHYTGELNEVKLTIPKLKGDNLAGQVNTTLHEDMHLMDLFGRGDNGKWFSVNNKPLVDTFKATNADMTDEISELFKKHNAEFGTVVKTAQKRYDEAVKEARTKYLMGDISPDEYTKERRKIQKAMNEEIEYEGRNIMGGGVGNLQDIFDALSGGTYRADGTIIFGHGQQYYAYESKRITETIAQYATLSVTRPDLIDMLRRAKPELCDALDKAIIELAKKAGV